MFFNLVNGKIIIKFGTKFNLNELLTFKTNDKMKLRTIFKPNRDDFSILPISLLLWTPMTFMVISSLYYHIRWDYFGITEGINPYYIDKFDSSLDSYLWIVSEIGITGMILFVLLSIGYIILTKMVICGVIYIFNNNQLERTKTNH